MKRAAAGLATVMLLGLFLAAPVAAAPQVANPTARAWALRIDLPGLDDAMVWADVTSAAGTAPRASGRPFVLAGKAFPGEVIATPDAPDSVTTLQDFTDQTGSLTAQYAFGEAHADDVSSTARAGWETISGNGAALANEFFTFEQQAQLLGQWTDLNEAVFGPVNETLGTIGGLLGTAGLEVPVLEPISAAGLVNVMNAQEVASSASTSLTPGFASARADTAIRRFQMFGGFIDVEGLTARAVSESADGVDTREANATIGRLEIAGVEVVADAGGLRVAGNDVLSRTVVQPAFDVLLEALAIGGIHIRVADPRANGIRRDAVALQIQVDSPQGPALVSVAYAEAAAPTVVPLGGGSSGSTGPAPPASAPVRPPGGDAASPPATGGDRIDPGPVAARPADLGSGPWLRRLPIEVARALRTAYLLIAVAAIAGALTIPVLLGRRRPAPARIVITTTRSIAKEEAS